MSDTTQSPQPRRLTRRDAAAYLLNQWGIRNSEQTLARKAVEGKGPKFSKFGHAVVYTTDALDEYAQGGLSRELSSTSDHGAAPAAA